ncbi:hypothetical protein AAZU54_08510 [Pseudomonas sp. Je.1.5.c]|uniref:hypothetical protein n=1 Tax=Pseudomonas sp. Je.1.5.c TaxID=3142839 RepID=UPI003DA907DC
MNRKLLMESCRTLAAAGAWCVPESTLVGFAGYPTKDYFRVAMARHVKACIIEKIAPTLYSNPFLSPPAAGLFRLTNFLRPLDSFYLSCESVLSEHGWISQLPFCLTFVTTGRSYRYSTLLGDIDFVHTEEDPVSWLGHLQRNEERQVWEASPEKALADLQRYKRNLGLVLPEHQRP